VLEKVDLLRFSNLEEIVLDDVIFPYDFTVEEFFNTISNKEKVVSIKLINVDIQKINLSEFISINELYLDKVECSDLFFSNLVKSNINSFYLKDLSNWRILENLDYSSLINMTEITLEQSFRNMRNKYKVDLVNFNNNINACKLKRIKINDFSRGDFDFSKYTGIEEIDVESVLSFENKMFSTFTNKENVRKLKLTEDFVYDFDFSQFRSLNYLDLSNDELSIDDLTIEQFNSIPNKASIEDLRLDGREVEGFDFSGLTALKRLHLSDVKKLTAAQFNSIPNKGIIEYLDLSDVNIAGFDFSGFTGLKTINLEGVEGLIKNQFETIPNRDSIVKQLSEVL
jgi:hypothetical protein